MDNNLFALAVEHLSGEISPEEFWDDASRMGATPCQASAALDAAEWDLSQGLV